MSFLDRYQGAALVTGASSGIGEQLARSLARRKMPLILVARREDKLRTLADALAAEFQIRCETLVADLADLEQLKSVPPRVSESGLEVRLLVNNAGTGYYGPSWESSPSESSRIVDLNCRAPVFLTQAFLPSMRNAGRGALLFVGSTASFVSTPYCAAYGASKAFDLAFAEALWAELIGSGVDVLAVCPGYTATEFQAVAGSDAMPRIGGVHRPEDIAEAALKGLGRGPSLVPGVMDRLLLSVSRCIPRKTAARLARKFNAPPQLNRG